MCLSEEEALVLEDNGIAQLVFGPGDRNLKLIEDQVGVRVFARGNRVQVRGPTLEAKLARRVVLELYQLAKEGVDLHPEEVVESLRMSQERSSPQAAALQAGESVEVGRRRRVVPRTENQRLYVRTIRSHDLVFGIGPAGTGKTYLAMATAVQALHRREVGRIILTRPAVEAGESLGFLPGTLTEKVDPYLRPLYDALHDMMDPGEIQRRLERGVIEVAPLAYMRGRTLNDAFVLLDEAQNTTSEQMRMFLTRLGFDSCCVVNGDVTQIDLPGSVTSGLTEAASVLADVEDIAFVHFNEKDVVRHPLVQEIIRAYDRYEPVSRGA
ncbi:MAG: PhoH family protein [Myxococcota bacterium]